MHSRTFQLTKNTEKILDGLNDAQKEAARHLDGPALSTATAGSGKTATIIRRTAYMIANGIDANKILLTTFTNKAAREIKDRIIDIIGEQGKAITVGTYHSICNKILRKYCTHLDYIKTFSILDEEESDKIIKEIAKEYGEDFMNLKRFMNNCKLKCKTPSMAHKEAKRTNTVRLSNCYTAYQDELKRQQAMDFDDLLLNTVLLLESNPEIKNEVNNKWQYINADEIQDSSELDSRLIYNLSGPNHNVFMVGDDDQGIYGFRGADIGIILNLKSIYPDLKWYNLGINYRSTKTIVEAGQSLIKNNKVKLEKKVICGNQNNGSPIIVSNAKNQKEEANKIVLFIQTLHKRKENPVAYKDIAVLFRMSYLSRTIEEALMKAKIKYKLVGGTPFFCRTEIKDILSYARLTVNEFDMQAFKRTIGIPKRGIGDKSIEKIEQFMFENTDTNMSIRKAIDDSTLPLKGKPKAGLKEYNNFLKKLDEKKTELSPEEYIKYIINELDYNNYLRENYRDTYEERYENLQELINICKEYSDIEDLLIEASLYKDDISDEEDAVQLMTIHKSKGLEFEAVFMMNMVEGTCPHYKSFDDPKQLEEERRLAFVGCTRPKKYLFLTYPKEQIIMNSPRYATPSRFIKEINPKYIHRI